MKSEIIGSAVGATAFVWLGKGLGKSLDTHMQLNGIDGGLKAFSMPRSGKIISIIMLAALGAAAGYVMVELFGDIKIQAEKKTW